MYSVTESLAFSSLTVGTSTWNSPGEKKKNPIRRREALETNSTALQKQRGERTAPFCGHISSCSLIYRLAINSKIRRQPCTSSLCTKWQSKFHELSPPKSCKNSAISASAVFFFPHLKLFIYRRIHSLPTDRKQVNKLTSTWRLCTILFQGHAQQNDWRPACSKNGYTTHTYE